MPPALQDLLYRVGVLSFQAVHLQELAESQHRIQGGAQLMAHAGQELALGAVRPIGLILGARERLLQGDGLGDVAGHRDAAQGPAILVGHGLRSSLQHDPVPVCVSDPVPDLDRLAALQGGAKQLGSLVRVVWMNE